ncbi:hypothetical protein AMAG_14913 [Allomyces macrogynus ATCC 38327]|uniref:Translation initiation factor eIF2B subunit epsilon n=1 Tax=Allomyces macrogynus (strain ATCC 38327) TaxID=578462 RepID=A0A0L0T7U6_ALLM3|nr:hypothetical protein AMAG_14913 [Allomyces macrogynus ATCC 38327]|eukprot:KNE70795.1 hypothetical protein AMAG_14913 [Allomyces macrogynus ATCC 38327]
MAPNNSNKLEAEEILQAVVVADSFDEKFMPLTRDLPRCLLPLCNVPLIEYTLEFLAVADVKEVFIVCCAHSDLIKEYILSSKWNDDTSSMKVNIIVGAQEEARRVRQAARAQGAQRAPCRGASARPSCSHSNHPAHSLPQTRNAALSQNSHATTVMTMVLKEGAVFHGARGAPALFCINPTSSRCVQYIPIDDPAGPARQHDVALLPEVLAEHADVAVRNDLIDCGVDICSVEVLALFSENFDYQDLRSDFVKGILESDLFVKSIYAHVVADAYAVRVRSTQLYDRVARDVLCRWTFPLVPDADALASLVTGGAAKSSTAAAHAAPVLYSRNNVYREKPVLLSRTTVLSKNVLVGRHGSIGAGTVLENCVVGRGCTIGKNVRLSNAYLWDGVTVGDGCTVDHAIVGRNVVLKDGVSVPRGSMIGQGVVVGKGIALPERTRLMVDEDDESDATVVGPDGRGCKWVAEDEDDSDDEGAMSPELTMLIEEIGFSPLDVRAYLDRKALEHDLVENDADNDSDESDDDAVEDAAEEVRATIQRALDQGHTLDNAMLELNTLKFACNLTFKDVRDEVVPCILAHVFIANDGSFKALLTRWMPVLATMLHGAKDQVDVLETVAAWFAAHLDKAKYLGTVAMVMYDLDLVEEEQFVAWFAAAEKSGETGMPAVCRAVRPFIQWLEEADDDEEEDEEDSEEEESDDE